MARILPVALEKLIDELGRLPGVGQRTAERYAYYLLRADQRINDGMATAIHDIHARVKSCPITFALIDADEEVSALVENHRLFGSGLGWIDVHLLTSALLMDVKLWTRDRRLNAAAKRFGAAFKPHH